METMTRETAPRRVPLHARTGIDDLDRLAWREEWDLQQVIHPSGGRPYQAIWQDADGNRIHYLDDAALGIGYVVLHGPGAAALEATLRGAVAAVDDEEIRALERQAAGAEDRVTAAYLAGIRLGPAGGQALLEVLERALASDDAAVRRAAVLAAGYAERPELRGALERLGSHDPDPTVRREAAAVREALEAVWSGRHR